MTAYPTRSLSPSVRTHGPGTDLEHLLQSYVFCSRAGGKRPRPIDKAITSVLALLDFVRASGGPTSVHDIGPDELRRKPRVKWGPNPATHSGLLLSSRCQCRSNYHNPE